MKTGHEHSTPLTEDAVAALEEARRRKPGIGNAPVLPARKDASQAVSGHVVKHWWPKAEALAGLEEKPGRGWHSLRRKFASDLMDKPLKVLCELGGWKTARTVLECYQHPDEHQMRKALADRRRVRLWPQQRESNSGNRDLTRRGRLDISV